MVFIYKNIHESIGLGIKSWEFWDSLRAQKSRLLYTTYNYQRMKESKKKFILKKNDRKQLI